MLNQNSILQRLKPTKRLLVMDLVSQAGIDVSDWKNIKGGEKRASSNPKYCYNWAFSNNKAVVLNLWYEQLKLDKETVVVKINLRETSQKTDTKYSWKKRAQEFDDALRYAKRYDVPIRAIINDGTVRKGNSKNTKASEVKFRLLDTSEWAVLKYDIRTGNFVLRRGKPVVKLIDQFEIQEESQTEIARKKVLSTVFNRSQEVRRKVLQRANGYCEVCGEEGFVTREGFLYLETHHIKPLSENGKDHPGNVAAICANHHREAHFGENAKEIRSLLTKKNALYYKAKNK